MPDTSVVQWKGGDNVKVLNYIRGQLAGTDFDNRVPAATKSNIQDVMESMYNTPSIRNQFIDALFNKVGLNIIREIRYTNPLAKYKRGFMSMGESIEEVALGLLTAKSYNPDADYLEKMLFGQEKSEVDARWHRIGREDMYKLTLKNSVLKRAFLTPNGLNDLVTKQMSTIATSDEFDEFEIMLNLLNTYYDEDGFYKIAVPDINRLSADANDSKQFLKVVRAWSNRLPLKPSRLYNAAHMPIVPQKEDLELFITATGQANLDVEGLAAAFNIDKLEIANRTTIIPDDDIKIPGFQGVITTREFWICADTYVDMVQQPNVAGRYTNFFHHHEGIVSASPFVPALLLTSAEQDSINVINYDVTGLTAITVTDTQTASAISNSTVTRGNAYLVTGAATTTPAGAPDTVTGLTLKVSGAQDPKTSINQWGLLIVGLHETATKITVTAQSTLDRSYSTDVDLTVAGSLVQTTIGSRIDDDTTKIGNTDTPRIDEDTAAVGDTLSTTNGKWDTRGLNYTYQWKANGSNISGATNSTYTVQAGDAGKTITVDVTAKKTGFTDTTATSNGVVIATS